MLMTVFFQVNLSYLRILIQDNIKFKKKPALRRAFFNYLKVNYFLIKENNIKIAKNPAKPEPAKEPSTLVTFSITVTPNIAPEPNRISTATPNPKRVKTKAVKPVKKSPKYLNTLSIVK